jgi:phosphohistidine phosphatase
LKEGKNMKTLLVMRHGKSSWKEADLVDHDRPLNKRGTADVPRMGKLLRTERLVPELILTSSARRARDTAESAAHASGYTPEIRHLPSFYQADLETFYDTLSDLSDDIDRVMIVGHNPELEELVEALTGESFSLPTAALVNIELPILNWSELYPEVEGRVIKAWFPREIG